MADVGAYLTLKLARELFRKSPDRLEPAERRRLDTVAARQQELETLILSTPEAASVALPESSVASSLDGIRARYESETDYQADLECSGLSPASLRREVERDLIVEAVLERIGSRAARVSDTEVELFYFIHKARFVRSETRTLRHILITLNEALPGNEPDAARARIETIRLRLLKDAKRFEEQALKHSECPTAMNGGLLGVVSRGQLYPELEPAAFALAIGEISAVAESPMGLHLLRCDAIDPPRTLALAEAWERIRRHLDEQRRKACQKSWINALR